MTCIEISPTDEALMTSFGVVFGVFCIIVLAMVTVFLGYVFFWWVWYKLTDMKNDIRDWLKKVRP